MAVAVDVDDDDKGEEVEVMAADELGEENVKKWRSLIRNFTNGILEILLDSSDDDDDDEEMRKEVGGGGGDEKERVLFAPTQGLLFKPQLGYLM